MSNRHIRSQAVMLGTILTLLILANCRLLAQGERAKQESNVRVVFRAKRESYSGKWTGKVLETVRSVLEKRARNQGVTKATFTAQLPDRIVAELPRAKATKAFLHYLRSPSRLEFYLLPQLGNREGTRVAIWRLSENPKTKEDILVDITTGQPLTKKQMNARIFHRPPPLSGKTLLPKCRAIIQPGVGKPVIEFEFNAEGAIILEEITRANVGEHLGIFLNQRLLTAPTINANISGGKGVLEANFTLGSAKALAAQLNAGSLPVPVEILSR